MNRAFDYNRRHIFGFDAYIRKPNFRCLYRRLGRGYKVGHGATLLCVYSAYNPGYDGINDGRCTGSWYFDRLDGGFGGMYLWRENSMVPYNIQHSAVPHTANVVYFLPDFLGGDRLASNGAFYKRFQKENKKLKSLVDFSTRLFLV